jgi:acetolactate synthase-1/3 small subunit
MNTMQNTPMHTLELLVQNHPGVMMHVVGLFARRAFNLEAIACFPLPGNEQSRMWLRLRRDGRLEQVVAQLKKLEDVVEVTHRNPSESDFAQWERSFGSDA